MRKIALVVLAALMTACGGGESSSSGLNPAGPGGNTNPPVVIGDPDTDGEAGDNVAPTLNVDISSFSLGGGASQTFQVAATDANGDPLTVTATVSPAGLLTVTQVDATTWRATATGAPGTATVTVSVTDGVETVTHTVAVEIVNLPPAFTSTPDSQVIDEDFGTMTLQVTASDPEGDPLSWFITSANGKVTASIDTSGQITLTSKANIFGSDSLTVTIGDGHTEVSTTVDIELRDTATFWFDFNLYQGMLGGGDSRQARAGNWGSVIGAKIHKPIIRIRDAQGVDTWPAATLPQSDIHYPTPPTVTLRVGEPYTITMYAASGYDHENPDCIAVDNTSGGAVYSHTESFTPSSAEDSNGWYEFWVPTNFNWIDQGYDGPRTSTPFSLCGGMEYLIDRAKKMVPTLSHKTVVINWSEDNIPVEGDVSLGEIGTSHYADGEIFLLGAYDIDTDEFDLSVIAHQYFRFLEEQVGRTDTVPGVYAFDDILDPRAAWSEGAALAFASNFNWGDMWSIPGVYSDNSGVAMEDVMMLDIEHYNGTPGLHPVGVPYDGSYSAMAVASILYDMFEADFGDSDADPFPSAALWRDQNRALGVILGDMAEHPSFATLPAFLHLMKLAGPDDAAHVDMLATALGVGTVDGWEDTNLQLYSTLTVGGTTTLDFDGQPLATSDTFGPIEATSQGNKLYNRAFLRADFTGGDTTCYALTATPLDGQNLSIGSYAGLVVDSEGAGSAETLYFTPLSTAMAFDVGSYLIPGRFTASLQPAASASFCAL